MCGKSNLLGALGAVAVSAVPFGLATDDLTEENELLDTIGLQAEAINKQREVIETLDVEVAAFKAIADRAFGVYDNIYNTVQDIRASVSLLEDAKHQLNEAGFPEATEKLSKTAADLDGFATSFEVVQRVLCGIMTTDLSCAVGDSELE